MRLRSLVFTLVLAVAACGDDPRPPAAIITQGELEVRVWDAPAPEGDVELGHPVGVGRAGGGEYTVGHVKVARGELAPDPVLVAAAGDDADGEVSEGATVMVEGLMGVP